MKYFLLALKAQRIEPYALKVKKNLQTQSCLKIVFAELKLKCQYLMCVSLNIFYGEIGLQANNKYPMELK
jgi:hypothetical protein